jgi:hypothetical protein
MMLNNYYILCLLALVAFIQSMPTNSSESSEEEKDSKRFISREIHEKIDGATHHIKSAGVTYQQRIKHEQCFVDYDGQLLAETSVIKIRKKIFRVEDCVLERVYQTCGPNLLLMLSVVCRVVEQHKTSNVYTNFKREASLSSIDHFDITEDKVKRVITESCCENLCSIAELTRYCHQ